MILAPYRVCRDMDDDYAPVDYSYVSSSSEAARQRQQQNIKRPGAAGVAARHRAEPTQKADAYGIRARELPKDSGVRDTVMRKLPSLEDGAPQAASVAYPDDLGIPDNPFAPPPQPGGRASVGTRIVESGTREGAGRSARTRAAGYDAVAVPSAREPQPAMEASAPSPSAQPAPRAAQAPESAQGGIAAADARAGAARAPEGAQFDPPLTPEMPEWLRIANQNPLPAEVRRARAPRVQNAPTPVPDNAVQTDVLGRPLRARASEPQRQAGAVPQRASEYAEAGYPEPLVGEQAALESEIAELGRRRRHGAQYAVNPYRQEEYERGAGAAQSSYPPRRQQADGGRQPYPMDGREAAELRSQPRDDTRGAAYEAASAGGVYARHNARRSEPVRDEAEASPYQVVDDSWHDEESDLAPVYEERPPIPWLLVAALASAVIAVALWLMQLTFEKQIEQVILAREGVNQTIMERHPYHYRELIEKYALKYNLNPAFVASIVLNESSFNPNAVSSVGARGLMQLMNDTASWISEKMGISDGYSFDNMFFVETNLDYGCWYLGFLCDRFRGDPVLVSAAFHAGQNTVQNWLNDSRYSADSLTIKLEDMMDGPTKQYATRVTRDYSIYLGLFYTEDEA